MTGCPPSQGVLVRREGAVGRLTLDRPGALHALTTAMCGTMIDALLAWRRDPGVALIMIDHSGGRGFCAGGDIRMLAQSGAEDGVAARAFFHDEYRLNHLLFRYDRPVIAFMDGVVMGGGVGLSLPARHRIATERTTLAMPEVGIGLFPDVGAGWHLPRLAGKAGLWLALTGARIKAADCLKLGLATAFTPSDGLPALKAAIGADPQAAGGLIAASARDPGPAPIAAAEADIDRLFGQDSVESIVRALALDDSDWSRAQLAILRTRSPQTLKVAFRQLALGAACDSFAENMAMEYRIAARLAQRHDFIEGVRAVIVDKDNAPRWNPATLEAVSDSLLDGVFAPLPPAQEWTPLPELAA